MEPTTRGIARMMNVHLRIVEVVDDIVDGLLGAIRLLDYWLPEFSMSSGCSGCSASGRKSISEDGGMMPSCPCSSSIFDVSAIIIIHYIIDRFGILFCRVPSQSCT